MKKTLALFGACALTLAATHRTAAQDEGGKKTQLEKCEQKIARNQAKNEERAARGKEPKRLKGICGALETLLCIEEGDAECARAGYTPDFVKLHNGVDTQTDIDAAFADGVFQVVHIALDINHFEKVDKNHLSIRYVETVDFTPSAVLPPGFPPDAIPGFPTPQDTTFYQYEHALVTVDDEGRMVAWDQYGDNAEQQEVDAYAATMQAFFAILQGG